MRTDYQIEDLTFQNSETVTYRARNKNGRPYTLTRLNLSEKHLTPLQEGGFDAAYARLYNLKHGCLRAIADGGLDSVDGIPWIATRWWEGILLSDQIEKKTLTGADIARVRFHGESLIHDMGKVAGALSFDPRTIVTTRSLEGEKVVTFEFNYSRWFTDSAKGVTPGGSDDPYENLNNLISTLEDEIEEIEDAPAPASPPTAKPTPIAEPAPVAAVPVLEIAKAAPVVTVAAQGPATASAPAHGLGKPGLTPIATPTSASELASAAPNKSNTSKKVAFIGFALGVIVAAAIALTQQGAPDSPESDSVNESPKSSPADKSVAKIDGSIQPSPPAPPKQNKDGLPPRPEFNGEMLDIDADNPRDLAANVGDWVVIRGKITEVDDKGAIHFADSPLKGFLLEGSAEPAIGGDAKITGILTSEKSLRIESTDDISYKKSYPKIYTLKDEAEIRKLNNETVTVRGKVQDFTKTDSGSSLYLVFHENGPGFRAGISPEKTSTDIDEEWLRQFIGKEILVNGRVTTFENAKDNRGKRLVIRFHRKANIRLAE